MCTNNYVTEIKEAHLEIYKQVACPFGFASFKHLILPISIKIPVATYLHVSYITKFDFMNYAFFPSCKLHGCISW